MQKSTIVTYDPLGLAIDRAKSARQRGVRWLLNNIDPNGKPHGSDDKIGWSRLIWGLAMAGETETAASVIAWAERSGQFKANGDFSADPPKGYDENRWYWLLHYAIGAWLTGSYDVALRTIRMVKSMQDPFGGIPQFSKTKLPYADLISTTQAGYTALLTGENEMADAVYHWVSRLVEQQPSMDKSLFYYCCDGDKLVTDIPAGKEYFFVTDFSKPQQAYFVTGITAAFLAAYAQFRGVKEPIDVAERLLMLNKNGTEHQFCDPGIIQICKYGWGLAAVFLARPESKDTWLPELLRMAHWFADWQKDDGSWAPSPFQTTTPTVVDKTAKTCEHVMEVSMILQALGYARAMIK